MALSHTYSIICSIHLVLSLTLLILLFQVRKWKMLARHHGDGTGKQKEAESDVHLGGCQSWGVHASSLLASPVMLECSICSGPYISYTLEDIWQPRQRTQASSYCVQLIKLQVANSHLSQ